MPTYREELKRAMDYLATKNNTIFMGQAVAYEGTGMSNSFKDIDKSKLLELPVEEDLQLGMAIGMSLNNIVPICIFPRWNFLLLATNQIVNHLDKMETLLQGEYQGRVIIRTAIGSVSPLYPGPQHSGDFTDAFKLMCENINIIRIENKNEIFEVYSDAYDSNDKKSSIIIEQSDCYDQ